MSIDRSDEGMTVIELIVAIIIMGIIIAPLSASIVIGLVSTEQSIQRATDTTDQQILASFFVNDVQSADDVSLATGCGGAGTVLQLHWKDPLTAADKTAAYVTAGAELQRVVCTASGTTTNVVVHALGSASPLCDGVACPATVASPPSAANKPQTVTFAVTAKGATSGPSYESYSFTLTGTRRVTA